MTLPEFSVRRRITITMLILIIALFGVISYTNLGLDMLPELEYPFVSVVTSYEGVGSEEIETLITKPVEQTVSTVEGLKEITSISSEGISAVYLEFEYGINLDFAAQDVREKLSWIEEFMPDDAQTPMVLKFNTSDMPILEYGVTGMENTRRLRQYIEDTLAPRIEKLEGIASVQVWGGKEREIQVLIDPNAMQASGLSLDTIQKAIMASNLNLSGGHVETLQKEYLVRTTGYLDNLDELRNTVVSITKEGKTIRLNEVASVVDSFVEIRGYERTNGKPSVIIAIMKQSGVNTLKASELVKQELAQMQALLPADLQLSMVFDQGDFIRKSISSTGNNALMGGVIAIFVVFIFLRSFRPTVTIALAIPLSIITTFIGMAVLGYTFNMMTLGGIALGVGLLVDNAVVVIENTFRHLESGAPRDQAAISGASEVGLAIMASTLTTMAVFLPMSLTQSIAGKLARPLSLTVCLSLLASLFVAVTIIPAIAATIFKKERSMYANIQGQGWISVLQGRYRRALEWALNHKLLVLGGSLIALVLAIVLTPMLGSEFMPRQDIAFGQLKIAMPEGTTLAETDHLTRQIEKLFMDREETVTTIGQVGITSGATYQAASGDSFGVNNAQVFMRFTDSTEREKTGDEITNEVRELFPDLEGVDYKFQDVSASLMGGSGHPIEINLYGSDLDELDRLSDEIVQQLGAVEGLKDIEKSLKKSKPEIHVRVDRQKASQMGLSVYQIASTVETAMLGRVVSKYHESGDEYDIRLRFQKSYREDIADLSQINISSPLGFTLPLSQVTSLAKDYGPITINRKNQARVVSITGIDFGRDLGSIVKDIQGIMRATPMPEGYYYDIGGAYEDMQTSFKQLSLAFLVAIILIYMVMAAQFESLSQPFIVMFTLPLAYIGVVAGLALTGKTLSVPAFMGLIILMGIVVNNGIVMIDYINQLRSGGRQRRAAVIEGAVVRLRPILITSLTTIAGMLPMAFASGEGSEMRSPMAVAVAFGLLFAMILTLFVVPSAYSIVDEIALRLRTRVGRIIIGEEEQPSTPQAL